MSDKAAEFAEGLSEAVAKESICALSIRQPWCHHILYNGKDVENRDWPTKGRGWFLIHAAKAWDGGSPEDPEMREAPRGGIVGAARIVDCVTDWDSKWWMGKYGFVLRDPIALPLIPCRGQLGFFKPEPDVLATVRRHLEETQNDK